MRYEIRDRIIHLNNIVGDPYYINIPDEEIIVSIDHVPHTTNMFTLITIKAAPHETEIDAETASHSNRTIHGNSQR